MLSPPRFTTRDEVEAYLWSCVHIDEIRISEEFIRLPSDMAYWNERYAVAYKHWLELKLKRDRTYATRYGEIRLELESAQLLLGKEGKRVVIADVEQALERDDSYLSVRTAEVAAEAEKVRLWGVLDAIRSKRDMLVSLGATQRAEMMSGLNGGDR